MSDPFNSRYNPNESGREHSCWGKIHAIRERTGLILTHDEISYICTYVWHCSDPEEFYRKMDSMSDEELEKVAKDAQLWAPSKKKKKLLSHESMMYT